MDKRPSAKVLQFPGGVLPGLGVATTASKGELISGSRNEVWLCQGYANGERGVMLFIKPDLRPRQMMIEALAAQVGQCMGLPCPDPFIVTVNPIHIGRKRGPAILAFGSEQVGNRSMVRGIPDPETVLDLMNSQKLTDHLCCFDELIANSVRGPRDVVFDAVHGVAIIDHEGAMEAETRPDEAVTNWFANCVLTTLLPDQRSTFLKKLRARAASAEAIQKAVIPSAAQFHQDGVRLYGELLEFLVRRLVHLDALLSKRVMPEQGYLSLQSMNDAPDRTA